MGAYIHGASVISPQHTFAANDFPGEIQEYSGVSYLKCIEPVYREFIDPMVSRRMSRIVKMGVCSALKCLQTTGISMPDAIIAGTGMGCLEDTEKFLNSIYVNDEKLLNPTPFIQSTHNTVAGAIALAIKCHHYNSTYTNRGFSFESALEDALLLIAENPGQHILTGGFDELTDTYYNITRRLGLWKNSKTDSKSLFRYGTRGSLPGEGVAFFMLGGNKGPDDLARLVQLKTFQYNGLSANITHQITLFLKHAGLAVEDIDLVMLGLNGDSRTDIIYNDLLQGIFSKSACIPFKDLCGEYDTASSFALWLASVILKKQRIPFKMFQGKNPNKIQHLLIYNHLRGMNHSLYLLERC